MKTLKINNNSITISSEEGLYIDNLVLGGVEISKKYFDEEGKKRGGVFAMIPNAGPGPKNTKIPQHGFVRISKGKFIENDAKNIISQKIVFEENIDFPYLYEVQNDNILFEDKNRVKIIYTIKNLGTEKMPISIGFHPYFKVKDFLKKDIIWDFKGGNKISENFDLWKNGGTYFFENNLEEYKIFIPELGNLKIKFSSNFKRIWIWSPKNGDSVCFEPNMNDYDGLTNNPSYLKAGEKKTFFMEISLEK